MSGLNELLRDLGRNARLENEYQNDPEAVMARYRLQEEERQALRERDLDRIKALSGSRDLSMTNSTISSYDE